MSGLTTEKTNDLVDKKVKKKYDNVGKSFKSILSDFNVMPYLIGFVIALSFNKFLNEIVKIISEKIFNIKNPLFEAFIELILVILLIYLFIYEFYYKYLFDEDISKERIVKTAINQAKVEEAKKEIKKDPQTQKEIEKTIELNKNIEEYFTTSYILNYI
jgi:uncharacterized protein YacL